MARFYDHPVTGKLHLEAVAGGTGGGATSVFDAPAAEADIRAHPNEHAAYKRAKAGMAQSQQHSAHLTQAEKAALSEKISELQQDVAALPDN